MAASQEEILEAISNMTVMQVVDLISAMEEKFGVSAAAAVAAVPNPGLLLLVGQGLLVSHGGIQAKI